MGTATTQTTQCSSLPEPHRTIDEARERLHDADTIVHLAVSPDELEQLQDTLATLRDRDVIVRIALHEGYREIDDPAELDIQYSAVASEVRFCSSVLPFLAMIDGDLTVFGVQSRHGNEYGMVIDDHIHSSILHWYFQIQLWEPWNTIYSSEETDETTYTSIREFIRDIESIRKTNEQVVVRVEGIETFSGEPVKITGTVDDIVYTDSGIADDQPFSQLFIQAAIVVSDDEDEYTIGGYGAILEDIRAVRITIRSIE
ncbi:TrmB family transcriptional regulator sugar-binding domain-containing protein [Halomicroarcula sp. GCM10025710]